MGHISSQFQQNTLRRKKMQGKQEEEEVFSH